MDSKPSVSIVTEKGETFVEICQILNGLHNRIAVEVKNFGNFMFLLKSIDDRMRNKSVGNTSEDGIQPKHKKVKILENVCSEYFPEYNPEILQPHEQYIPTEKLEKTNEHVRFKSVRDDLLEIICEKLCENIRSKVESRCTECMLGLPMKVQHSVCKLSRKEKIELVFEEMYYDLDENTLKDLLSERRQNGVLPYNKQMYIEKHILLKNAGWVKKLKNRIERYM